MFPGAGAQVYHNEAGEPIGWDYPSDEPYEMDPYEYDMKYGARDARAEELYEEGKDDAEEGRDKQTGFDHDWEQSAYNDGYADGTPSLADEHDHIER